MKDIIPLAAGAFLFACVNQAEAKIDENLFFDKMSEVEAINVNLDFAECVRHYINNPIIRGAVRGEIMREEGMDSNPTEEDVTANLMPRVIKLACSGNPEVLSQAEQIIDKMKEVNGENAVIDMLKHHSDLRVITEGLVIE